MTKMLTLSETAAVLGISSPQTIKNWLVEGFFTGRTRLGGSWLFPEDEVLLVKQRMREIAEKNSTGCMTPVDLSDEDE